MLKNLNVRAFLSKFDFIFICETHSTKESTIDIPGYHPVHNPCKMSRHVDVPRGGCIMFVRDPLRKYFFHPMPQYIRGHVALLLARTGAYTYISNFILIGRKIIKNI